MEADDILTSRPCPDPRVVQLSLRPISTEANIFAFVGINDSSMGILISVVDGFERKK